jgi:hypothetical protein
MIASRLQSSVGLAGFETKSLIPFRQLVVIEKGLLGSATPKGPGNGKNLGAGLDQ